MPQFLRDIEIHHTSVALASAASNASVTARIAGLATTDAPWISYRVGGTGTLSAKFRVWVSAADTLAAAPSSAQSHAAVTVDVYWSARA